MKTVERVESDVRRPPPEKQEELRDWLENLLEDHLVFRDEFKAKIERGEEDIRKGRSRIRKPWIGKVIYAATFLSAMFIQAQATSLPTAPSTNEDIQAAHLEVTTLPIIPSATDAAIRTFDNPHWFYVNRDIVVEHKADLAQDRHELYLFIPGTHEKGEPRRKGPEGPVVFCDFAADLGYHVVVLSYPDETPASVCRNDSDPNAFEEFRMAIIQGGRSKHINVERSESIENRLIKLLQHLEKIRPRENWGQFLNQDGTIKWETIAVGGQSQGGGHAALIAIQHRVARVICTGAPKDYSQNRNMPAAFYSKESATPKGRFFAFNHRQDCTGDTSPEQLLKNLKAIGLEAFGPPADVDTEPFPYHHARILMTGYPVVTVTGPQSEGSLTAHFSMLNPQNEDRWKQVWTYMLTETARWRECGSPDRFGPQRSRSRSGWPLCVERAR